MAKKKKVVRRSVILKEQGYTLHRYSGGKYSITHFDGDSKGNLEYEEAFGLFERLTCAAHMFERGLISNREYDAWKQELR